MATRTCKVGIHGRNQEDWSDRDFQVLRNARAEVVKMMSHSRPQVFERIKNENPGIEIITRLHGEGFNTGGHPNADEFAMRMIPVMGALKPYCIKFQVHNEPNHVARYEGWGNTDDDARNFNQWFLEVYGKLKAAHPWASIGFPGLALPHFGHRDWQWLDICRPAIQQADWLGVHCYWQTPPNEKPQYMHEALGMNFRHYHEKFPNKTLEILECGNSNIQNGYPISNEAIADEYVAWLQEVFKHSYVNSASFFLLSSQDPQWGFFAWRTEDGAEKPVVFRVKDMARPELRAVHTPPPTPKPTRPVTTPTGLTNQQVIQAFNRASLQLGMGNWGLMSLAGLSLNKLAANRQVAYTGPRLADMPKLSDEQRQLIRSLLPEGLEFDVTGFEGLLVRDEALLLAAMDYPRPLHMRVTRGVAARVARAWNYYGNLLTQIAERVGIDQDLAVAVLATSSDVRRQGSGRPPQVRFDVSLFFGLWGHDYEAQFAEYFRFDPIQPSQGQQWRANAGAPWSDVHENQASEWGALELARSLDKPAACEAAEMGFTRLLGAAYDLVGYESAAQMLDAFANSERFQVLALFDLIGGPGARTRESEALRERNLEAFASLYVGPGGSARYAAALREAIAAFDQLSPLN